MSVATGEIVVTVNPQPGRVVIPVGVVQFPVVVLLTNEAGILLTNEAGVILEKG